MHTITHLNLCHCLGECPAQGHVANLGGNREPLEKVRKGEGLSSSSLQPPTELSKEAHGLWPGSATGLHSNWLELVGSAQMGIFLCLLQLSVCCSPTPFFGGWCPMGITKGIYTSGVSHQEFPLGPWNHGYTIPLALYRPDGSSLLGMLAEAKEWWTMLFSILILPMITARCYFI